MALLTTQPVTVAGLTPALVAAAVGGDTAKPGPNTFLVVKNTDATSKTVTLATPGNLATGDAYPEKAYTVVNGTEKWVPLLPLYRDKTDGLAHITYSNITGVTVAVVSI